ncbi:MAG: hypothetical protein KGJ13_02290 [Patescibacteria group bacterium]|nr:hypothetical protein [Patescibacteria group bacterium]
MEQHLLNYALSFAAGFAAGHVKLMAHMAFSFLMKIPGAPAFVRAHAGEINQDVADASAQIQSDVKAEAAAPEPPKPS